MAFEAQMCRNPSRRKARPFSRTPSKAQRSGFARKKEEGESIMEFSPQGGNGMARTSSDAVRRMCSCQPRVTSVHNILYVYNMTNSAQKQHIFSNMRIFQTCAQIRWSTTGVPADRQAVRRGCAYIGIFCTIPVLSLASAK